MALCADRGVAVDLDRGRAYQGVGAWFCAPSASEVGGGAYDELRDLWSRVPDVGDLVDRED
jgi:hypothetical protein